MLGRMSVFMDTEYGVLVDAYSAIRSAVDFEAIALFDGLEEVAGAVGAGVVSPAALAEAAVAIFRAQIVFLVWGEVVIVVVVRGVVDGLVWDERVVFFAHSSFAVGSRTDWIGEAVACQRCGTRGAPHSWVKVAYRTLGDVADAGRSGVVALSLCFKVVLMAAGRTLYWLRVL